MKKMDVIGITDENINEFSALLGEDLTEDMNRVFYRGLAAVGNDGEAKGAMVYELINADNCDEDISGALRFLSADDVDTYAALHEAYLENCVENEEITESFYQFGEEKAADSCEKAGFSRETKESDYIRFTLKDALALAFFSKKKTVPYYIASIGEISDEQYRSAVKNFLFIGQKGIMEDFGYLKRDWFDGELSTCIITDNKVSGLFLVRALPSGILMPVFMYAQGTDYTKNIVNMLTLSIKMAEKKYPPETEIQICRSKKATWDLIKKLFPRLRGGNVFFGRREETA